MYHRYFYTNYILIVPNIIYYYLLLFITIYVTKFRFAPFKYLNNIILNYIHIDTK